MTPLITLHTHSSYCGHASATLDQMVHQAHAQGVAYLGVSEHYPLTEKFNLKGKISMPADEVDSYLSHIQRLRVQYPQMSITAGCELDWLGASEDRCFTPGQFDTFDMVLGSVHFLGTWLVNGSFGLYGWKDADVDQVWRDYVDEWCSMASAPSPITCLAHPDVVKKYGFMPSFDLGPLYDLMVEATRASARMIEVNTAGLRHPCGQLYPAPGLLARFAQAQVACTVGTDAHGTADVASGIRQAYQAMYEAGYRQVSVVLPGGEVREFDL